jgi:hypothetical protein
MKLLLSLPLLCCSAFSQGAAVPPPIVQIVAMPGDAGGPARSYANGRAAVDVLGLSATTGIRQVWWIEMHPTFAGIEALDRALNLPALGNLNGGARVMIAVLQPGWSYRPEEAARSLSKARYMRVAIHRIGLGKEAEFGEMVRLRKVTSDSVNLDRPDLIYHVVSGDDSGTYIVLSPLSSLAMLDEEVADVPASVAPAAEALAKAQSNAAAIEISREHLLFQVDPRLSYVSDAFAAGDSFWRP